MECKEANELFNSYLLGALDPSERSLFEAHIESCAKCSERLKGDGELVVELAYAAPRLEVPPRVKEQLFARIDAETQVEPPSEIRTRPVSIPFAWSRLVAPGGLALAAMMVVGLVVGGVWFNGRINKVAEENEAITARLDTAGGGQGQPIETMTGTLNRLTTDSRVMQVALNTMAAGEAEMSDMFKKQRYLTYWTMAATPSQSVNILWGTEQTADAKGMIVAEPTGSWAILAALDLPQLSEGMVYRVWLIKGGRGFSSGHFTVDSTGYGQTVIIPVGPWYEFEAVEITVEPEGEKPWPTGDSVLKGDL